MVNNKVNIYHLAYKNAVGMRFRGKDDLLLFFRMQRKSNIELMTEAEVEVLDKVIESMKLWDFDGEFCLGKLDEESFQAEQQMLIEMKIRETFLSAEGQ